DDPCAPADLTKRGCLAWKEWRSSSGRRAATRAARPNAWRRSASSRGTGSMLADNGIGLAPPKLLADLFERGSIAPRAVSRRLDELLHRGWSPPRRWATTRPV